MNIFFFLNLFLLCEANENEESKQNNNPVETKDENFQKNNNESEVVNNDKIEVVNNEIEKKIIDQIKEDKKDFKKQFNNQNISVLFNIINTNKQFQLVKEEYSKSALDEYFRNINYILSININENQNHINYKFKDVPKLFDLAKFKVNQYSSYIKIEKLLSEIFEIYAQYNYKKKILEEMQKHEEMYEKINEYSKILLQINKITNLEYEMYQFECKNYQNKLKKIKKEIEILELKLKLFYSNNEYHFVFEDWLKFLEICCEFNFTNSQMQEINYKIISSKVSTILHFFVLFIPENHYGQESLNFSFYDLTSFGIKIKEIEMKKTEKFILNQDNIKQMLELQENLILINEEIENYQNYYELNLQKLENMKQMFSLKEISLEKIFEQNKRTIDLLHQLYELKNKKNKIMLNLIIQNGVMCSIIEIISGIK